METLIFIPKSTSQDCFFRKKNLKVEKHKKIIFSAFKCSKILTCPEGILQIGDLKNRAFLSLFMYHKRLS